MGLARGHWRGDRKARVVLHEQLLRSSSSSCAAQHLRGARRMRTRSISDSRIISVSRVAPLMNREPLVLESLSLSAVPLVRSTRGLLYEYIHSSLPEMAIYHRSFSDGHAAPLLLNILLHFQIFLCGDGEAISHTRMKTI